MGENQGHNQITLLNILIGSGLVFALLFFLGNWHLSFYFKELGTLIPIHELESIFIAQIGFYQILTIGIPLFLPFLFLKKKHKIGYLLIVIVLFLIFSATISAMLAKKDKPFDSTFINFITEDEVPNVELVYKIPLAINEQPAGSSFSNILSEVKSEEVELLDKSFNDDMKNKHYVAQFKLYFESEDNYYLRSKASFCELYGLLAKEALAQENKSATMREVSKLNTPLVATPLQQLDSAISLQNISSEVLKNLIDNNNVLMKPAQPSYIPSLPDTYIIEPIYNNSSKSEEQKEYENKRQCKLIILPKSQVESLKYYK